MYKINDEYRRNECRQAYVEVYAFRHTSFILNANYTNNILEVNKEAGSYYGEYVIFNNISLLFGTVYTPEKILQLHESIPMIFFIHNNFDIVSVLHQDMTYTTEVNTNYLTTTPSMVLSTEYT